MKALAPAPIFEVEKHMMTYDYKCETCGKEFSEKFHINDKKTNVKCPHCHSRKTHQVYSAPTIVFKGPGFYVTDHNSKSGKRKTENPIPEK